MQEASNELPASQYEVVDSEEIQDTNEHLTFEGGDETYAVGIADVAEIVTMQRITPVPDALPFVRGVINLRGTVIPVMDVRLRFGLEPLPYTDRTCIIVLTISETHVGLVVDAVSEVIDIAPAQTEPRPQNGSASGTAEMVRTFRVTSSPRLPSPRVAPRTNLPSS